MVGSPEWFHHEATKEEYLNFQEKVEAKRAKFIELFSPEKISRMDEEELLQKVFGSGSTTMMELLDNNGEYEDFGSTGQWKYLRPLYQLSTTPKKWKRFDCKIVLSYDEALEYAAKYRDDIVESVNLISSMEINSIEDYKRLSKELELRPRFLMFAPMMKYYQMVFPQYLPGIYIKAHLVRELRVLGFKPHAKDNRILNMGELSLFIRRCDVNNIVFNKIYKNQVGGTRVEKLCENAAENYDNRTDIPRSINLGYYNLPVYNVEREKENLQIVQEMEQRLEALHVEGEEREAIVKVRVNQGIFRERMLKEYGHCCLCNVSEPKLLIASHIKPWAVAEASEKLDINNGFLMCPDHDKLFDQGWISFDDEGKILISSRLQDKDRKSLRVTPNMEIKIRERSKKYLEYHRKEVFEK
jgi:hypothetical protein